MFASFCSIVIKLSFVVDFGSTLGFFLQVFGLTLSCFGICTRSLVLGFILGHCLFLFLLGDNLVVVLRVDIWSLIFKFIGNWFQGDNEQLALEKDQKLATKK